MQSQTPRDLQKFTDSLCSYSDTYIRPALHHLINSDTLLEWCRYVVDLAIVEVFPWNEPDPKVLLWRYSLSSEADLNRWLNTNLRQLSISWFSSASCAYLSAARTWFADSLEDIYVSKRHEYEHANCKIMDFGLNKGLAIETALSHEENPSQLDNLLASAEFSNITIFDENVMLGDRNSTISQLIASSSVGDLLPPFFNGNCWVLIKIINIYRPSRGELEPVLLRSSILNWREEAANMLVAYWSSQFQQSSFNHSERTPQP